MDNKQHAPRSFFAETREHWPVMSFYERFEQVVAIVLSVVIAVVIALALVQLIIRVVLLLLSGAIDPLEHNVFQALFGMIMTLLIAMEFKHSIVLVALRRRGRMRRAEGHRDSGPVLVLLLQFRLQRADARSRATRPFSRRSSGWSLLPWRGIMASVRES